MRREALELALYTFKYISDSQNVLVGAATAATRRRRARPARVPRPSPSRVRFRAKELQPLLDVPLSGAFRSTRLRWPISRAGRSQTEAKLVDEITGAGLFSSQVETQQKGGRLLVLSPLTP